MADRDNSLESTPTWAVAAVCATLILIALLLEHALHKLESFLGRRKRKTLNKVLYNIQVDLRSFGFMTLFLTVAQQPISKICIPESLGNTFLPCEVVVHENSSSEGTCKKGKVPLLSRKGTDQLLLLIFMLAVSHVLTCLVTFGLAMAKMSRWASWEEETQSVDYQLFNDPRRFRLAQQTSFGKRHLKFWSNYRLLTCLICFLRQLFDSVSKADYIALRHSFIAAHFGRDYMFDFHKFLRRSLDHDFVVVSGISCWSWAYALLFIFFNAQGLYSYLWIPFIPLLILLAVGTKLEVTLTTMCLDSSKEAAIVPGAFYVKPDNKYFWFGKQQWLLHVIHFILFQNSFMLAFFIWTWYNFGFPSCFHRKTEDIILSIGITGLVLFLCAYVTLPLYELVTQMDSAVREAIFTDTVIDGLKNWRNTARKNIATKRKSDPQTPTGSLHSVNGEGSSHAPTTEVLESEHPLDEDSDHTSIEIETEVKTYPPKTYDGEVSFGLWQKQDSDQLSERSWQER